MMDPACTAPEEGTGSGEQPGERPKRPRTEMESERLNVKPKSSGREMGKEKGR